MKEVNRSYKLNQKMKELVDKLAQLIKAKSEKSILLCGIYTGGVILGEELVTNLREKGVPVGKLTYVRLTKGNIYTVSETDLPKVIPPDTRVIFLDDAIWTGRTKFAVDDYMKEHFPKINYEFATLLDCAGYANYSVY